MKAVIFYEHGGPDVLRYDDVEEPTPGPGEVVLRVGALTVNPGPDAMTREGAFGLPGFSLPHIGGSDPAGRITAVGEGVDNVRVGDRVVVYPILSCGTCDFCLRGAGENSCRAWRLWGAQTWGGRADYARIPARNVVPLPDTVSYEQAATLPVSYITTRHGLIERARTGPGDTVLVMGSGGGCGVAAIQIAKLHGARVVAMTGAEWKCQRALEIGADVAFDYHREDWPKLVREATDGHGVSVVFDNVGSDTWTHSLSCLDREGRFVCSGATTGSAFAFDARWAYRNMLSLFFHMQGAKADLEALVGLIAEGRLDPVIDSRYELKETAAAERHLGSADHFGKILLLPDAGERGPS